MKALRRIVVVVILLVAPLIAGCHTVHGLGSDIKTMSAPYVQAEE